MNSTGKGLYAFSKIDWRESLLIYNNNTRQTMEEIEYII
jgi:hypothetical protein